jgi:hypothetical protein
MRKARRPALRRGCCGGAAAGGGGAARSCSPSTAAGASGSRRLRAQAPEGQGRRIGAGRSARAPEGDEVVCGPYTSAAEKVRGRRSPSSQKARPQPAVDVPDADVGQAHPEGAPDLGLERPARADERRRVLRGSGMTGPPPRSLIQAEPRIFFSSIQIF